MPTRRVRRPKAPRCSRRPTRHSLAGLVALSLLAGLIGQPALAAGNGGSTTASSGGAEALRYEMPTLRLMLVPEEGRLPMRLELGLTVELAAPEAVDLITRHQPMINDGVWLVLSRTQPSDLAHADGLADLRSELVRIITGIVGYGQVTDVYFREFLTRQPI